MSGLFGEASPDEYGDAGEGEREQQRAADEQNGAGAAHEFRVAGGDVLRGVEG